MPSRAETLPAGIIRLQKLLSYLNASPKLTLSSGVKQLRLALASQNDHFGARHFVKENLPQIRWANPNLDIVVRKEIKTPQEKWKAEMEVEFEDGKVEKVNMHDKWSSVILRELMDKAGDDAWRRHVVECNKAGVPILPEATPITPGKKPLSPESAEKLPTLAKFFEANPSAEKRHINNPRSVKLEKKKEKKTLSKSQPTPQRN